MEASKNRGLKEDLVLRMSGDTIHGQIPLNVNVQQLNPTIVHDGDSLYHDDRALLPYGTLDLSTGGALKVVRGGKYREYVVHCTYFNGLPVLIVFTENGAPVVSREKYVKASLKLIGDRTFDGFTNVEIRGRGNTSWGLPKKSCQIKFEKKREVLGMDKAKRWVLLSNMSDKTMLRNALAFRMSESSTLSWTPSSRFVDFIFNNSYLGTYQLTEKVEVNKQRLDIGKDGALVEADANEKIKNDDVTFRTKKHLYNLKNPKVGLEDPMYHESKDRITMMESALFSPDFKDPKLGYRAHMDVDAFVDWYIINEIARCNDAIFHSSVNLHFEKGGKVFMGPIWDYDIAFGNINYNGNSETEGFYIKSAKYVSRLFQDPWFVDMVKERYAYFYDRKGSYLNFIDEQAKVIYASQKNNYKTWPVLGKYIWPNKVYFETYEEEVDHLKQWLADRMDWLQGAISGL